jgi:hypothetical protein
MASVSIASLHNMLSLWQRWSRFAMRALRMTFSARDDTTARDRRGRGFSHRRSSTRSEPEKHKPAASSREAWAARNPGHVHRNIGLMGPGSAATERNPAEPFRSKPAPIARGAALRRTCRMSERGHNRNLNRQYPLIRAAGREWQGTTTNRAVWRVLRAHPRIEAILRPFLCAAAVDGRNAALDCSNKRPLGTSCFFP